MQEWKRESVQERRSCMGPSGTQEYSFLLQWKSLRLVGNVLSLKGAATGGSC
jgi:hypothetical protein